MKHFPRSSVMLICNGRIIAGKVLVPFNYAVCEKILRPYFANRYNLSLEDSLALQIIKI